MGNGNKKDQNKLAKIIIARGYALTVSAKYILLKTLAHGRDLTLLKPYHMTMLIACYLIPNF